MDIIEKGDLHLVVGGMMKQSGSGIGFSGLAPIQTNSPSLLGSQQLYNLSQQSGLQGLLDSQGVAVEWSEKTYSFEVGKTIYVTKTMDNNSYSDADLIEQISHEYGHITSGISVTPSDYSDQNSYVQNMLKSEGYAQMSAFDESSRLEAMNIKASAPGTSQDIIQEEGNIYTVMKAEGYSKDAIAEQIAQVVANESVLVNGQLESYTQYYNDGYTSWMKQYQGNHPAQHDDDNPPASGGGGGTVVVEPIQQAGPVNDDKDK